MNTKDFSKMAILDQGVLQKAENARFVVNKDYNLNEARLVVPKGMTIDLGNGSVIPCKIPKIMYLIMSIFFLLLCIIT